jgi:hypothetical protein
MPVDSETTRPRSNDTPGKPTSVLFQDRWQLRLVWFGWVALAAMGVLSVAVGGKDVLTGGATSEGLIPIVLLIIAGAWALLAWGSLVWLPRHVYGPARYRFSSSGLAIEYAWPAQSRDLEVAWTDVGVVEWHSAGNLRAVVHFHLTVPRREDLDLRGEARLLAMLREHLPDERIVELNPATGLPR